ncbi:MAG: proton-conducting transporter membrane subunit [Phycisphaerae bacterium]|nr:proton-conducting transporter membrane subunit [Phycisphaerae bacterium]
MAYEALLLAAVLIPTLGSLLLPMVGPVSARLRNYLAFVLIAVAFVCSAMLIRQVLRGEAIVVQMFGVRAFQADALAVFTACVSSLVSAIVVLYSFDYIREYPYQDEYYFMVTMFLGSMMGLVFATNLAVLYVFWELTAIASWRLIGFFRDKEYVRRADKAFLMTAFGALAMLLGFVILFAQAGSLDFAALKAYYAGHALPSLAVGLILLGILSKSATLPFQTWLPDAGVAPSPVTALLHAAVLVKIGVYAFARLFVVTLPLAGATLATHWGSVPWNQVVLVIAAASALISAGAAMIDTDIKRIIAFSTISQIAFIFLGFASGSAMGAAGATLYILMHGLAKGGLFLIAGVIEHGVHTKDIRLMGGLARKMPITAACYLLCAFSVMGIPPFGGFFSKYMVIGGAINGGHTWIALTFVFGAILTVVYLMRLFRMVFLGEAKRESHREGTPLMVGCVALLAALGIVGGFVINPPAVFAIKAVAAKALDLVSTGNNGLLLPVLLPFVVGLIVLAMPKVSATIRGAVTVAALLVNLIVVAMMFRNSVGLTYSAAWGGFFTFSLALTKFNGFIMLAATAFGLLVALYSVPFMKTRERTGEFYFYLLLTGAMANGAVLANHLVTMLFFWEGLLLPLFGMICLGRPGAWKTAIKALIIVGLTDLCLMAGIGIVYWQNNGNLMMNQHIPITGLLGLAAVLMIIGALGKGGSMPVHSWIPDAATDAPLPFMAFLPAAIEKLLGIYFLCQVCLNLFNMASVSWISPMLMIIGAATILLAVAMALVQKDFKRLLSYHAISQVGYMILGIGTGNAIGIVGGLYHMINNGLYKSLLFLTGGSVEHRTGTTDLAKLGGLGTKMPITFVCFLVAAFSISGFPLTNGFFSKEMIYDGAREVHHWGNWFYGAALLGSFLTAASFLKLGHAAFLGKRNAEHDTVREASPLMLLPMIVLAGACLVFAVSAIPVAKFLVPAYETTAFSINNAFVMPHADTFLIAMTCAVLAAAFINHLAGVKRTGAGLGAVDHIHYAPVLHTIYDKAEQRWFDPYEWLMGLFNLAARIGYLLDRLTDWLYEGVTVGLTRGLTGGVRWAHGPSYGMYIVWAVVGAAAVLWYLV